MSTLQYYSWPGWGEKASSELHYSQAVRVPAGDKIEISGQVGRGPNGELSESEAEQIAVAFANVEKTLKSAGVGFADVYKLRTYHAPVTEESMKLCVEQMRKYFGPDHKPCWTVIGVAMLARKELKIEVEVWAAVPS